MKKSLILILLLSGCVQYEQNPAQISEVNENPALNEVQVLPPQSESIPLTPLPGNITNQYLENQNQDSNQVLIINDGSVGNVDQKNIINPAPVGSFNNPVKFDDSKVYSPSTINNKKINNIEVVPGVEINKPLNIQ